MAYKLGALPRDHSRYAPTYEDYRTDQLPVVSDSTDVDRATEVTAWPMYDNDNLGDCTVAGIAHVIGAMAVYGGHPLPLFADTEIIKVYSAVSGYNPVTGTGDNGATLQSVLDYVKTNGITDLAGKTHTVVAYTALGTANDPTLLAEVLNSFGAVYVAINCPKSAQTEFGSVWTWQPCSPIIGGHCIGLHRRQPIGSTVGSSVFSTWGALQPVTPRFVKHYVNESWAIISQDWIDANGDSPSGLDLAQLMTDMQSV